MEGDMERILTLDDVVPAAQAVPPGASVEDLRIGAWIDDNGAVTVRNAASADDSCWICGSTVVNDLKNEFRTDRSGTNGALNHPNGETVIECFDWYPCLQRQVARDDLGNRFPPSVCGVYYPLPEYGLWTYGKLDFCTTALLLDQWLPEEERALALAGRAIGIWANNETVTQITPEGVEWDRPDEAVGARCEYVNMFASAGHGIALIAVALARGTAATYLSVGTAYEYAKKLHLHERYGGEFWDSPHP